MTLLGKIRELYVTSGFSSGTHNSCRLICLRFNPVKMSKWKRHFLFYILLVELVTKGVFKLLWMVVFGRLKLEIAQFKKRIKRVRFCCVAHVFKCNRLRLRAESFREEKAFE